MKPFVLLISAFILSCGISKLISGHWNTTFCGNLAMSLMLCFTAMGHFIFPKGMQMMLSSFLPLKAEVILLSGLLEIVFALALFFPGTRTYTGYALMLFFLLLLPANIYAVSKKVNIERADFSGPGISYLWFRIPFQLLLIGWVWYFCISYP